MKKSQVKYDRLKFISCSSHITFSFRFSLIRTLRDSTMISRHYLFVTIFTFHDLKVRHTTAFDIRVKRT
jgi:hypothetical protein